MKDVRRFVAGGMATGRLEPTGDRRPLAWLMMGLVLAATEGPTIARADDLPDAGNPRRLISEPAHSHPVVEVVGDPILARLRVRVRLPRRLVVDAENRMYVADSQAGRIQRVSADGPSALLADELNEPVDLAIDSQGRLFVALRAGARERGGSIVRVETDGTIVPVATGLTTPVAIALDDDDSVWVACAGDDTVAKVDREGRATVVARLDGAPVALVFHRKHLYVANGAKGTISRIDAAGRVELVADGFGGLSDLAVGPEQQLVACDAGRTIEVLLDGSGLTRPWLDVPAGTVAIAFDRNGNLLAASRRLHLVVRLTTRLEVPCPHCEGRIPLRIRPRSARSNDIPDAI